MQELYRESAVLVITKIVDKHNVFLRNHKRIFQELYKYILLYWYNIEMVLRTIKYNTYIINVRHKNTGLYEFQERDWNWTAFLTAVDLDLVIKRINQYRQKPGHDNDS